MFKYATNNCSNSINLTHKRIMKKNNNDKFFEDLFDKISNIFAMIVIVLVVVLVVAKIVQYIVM